jgi:1-deoxy-D-xylulose-5-phosphate synthase
MYAEAGLDAATIVKTALDTLPAASGQVEQASNVVSVRRRPR